MLIFDKLKMHFIYVKCKSKVAYFRIYFWFSKSSNLWIFQKSKKTFAKFGAFYREKCKFNKIWVEKKEKSNKRVTIYLVGGFKCHR